MSKRISRAALAEFATTQVEAPLPAASVDRTFELPGVLFGLTVACYLGFVAVMAFGLGEPGLIIPLSVCAIFVIMAFGVPSLWVRMKPATKSRSLDWSRFAERGIQTYTGRMSARDAAIQVLILPVLILLWAVITVIVAALV